MINFQISDSLMDLYNRTDVAAQARQEYSKAAAVLSNESLFESAAQQALDYANLEQPAELTLVLTEDADIHALNLQYRQVDAATDVLSFPAGETDPDTGNLYLGDIVISLPRAQAQAAAEGHSLEAELRLLVVHGVLHLLGYDHADDKEKAAMWAAQTAILKNL